MRYHVPRRFSKKKLGIEELFEDLSYPLSKEFRVGNLYLYALDFKGNIMAHGERPSLIGTNAWSYKDSTGKFINQEIIKRLKESSEGIWIEYISKNAPKKAYAEKIKDSKGNQFFVACGYYPDADRKATLDLVQRGYQFMKAHGKTEASRLFTDSSKFRYGDLYLFVYDMKGTCIAHGRNRAFVGRNHYNLQDEAGRYYIRELIKIGKSGSGWFNFKIKNFFQSAYVEKINLGVETFIIGCGLYPISKNETTALLLKSAAEYLRENNEEEAFRAFTDREGGFIRGDLFIFVVDSSGFCRVHGDTLNLIWKNIISWKDDKGRPFIKIMINTAKRGTGNVVYTMNKRPVVAYIDEVKKNNSRYLIGSSFYK